MCNKCAFKIYLNVGWTRTSSNYNSRRKRRHHLSITNELSPDDDEAMTYHRCKIHTSNTMNLKESKKLYIDTVLNSEPYSNLLMVITRDSTEFDNTLQILKTSVIDIRTELTILTSAISQLTNKALDSVSKSDYNKSVGII